MIDDATYPQFRTKTGMCFIRPDALALQRTGLRGVLAATLFGSIRRAQVSYSLIALGCLIAGMGSLLQQQWGPGLLCIVLSGLCFRNVSQSRRFSVAPLIARTSIQRIDEHPPQEGLTRGYFTVHYLEAGQMLQRLIMLPGSTAGGTGEYHRARQLFQAAELLPADFAPPCIPQDNQGAAE